MALQRAAEPSASAVRRLARRSPVAYSSRGPFEDEHVGVDGHADREHEAGEAGQGERGAERDQRRVGDQPVADQRDGGEQRRRAGRRR